jgi:hypothetical protein
LASPAARASSQTFSAFKKQKIVWDPSKLPKYQQLAGDALADALDYWDSPECISLLSSLISKLLVTCATSVFDPRSPPFKSHTPKASLKVRQAQNLLSKTFNEWKEAGRPSSNSNNAKAAYREARRNLQSLGRYEDNLQAIKQNNYLMHLNTSN